jgi:large conductance mechanosensitive channel
MSLMREFKDFVNKGNVIDLAVALVMGTAFSKIVDQIVKGAIMPVALSFMPRGEWQNWHIWKIQMGAIIDAIIQFLVVSFVIFLVLKKFFNYQKKEAAVAPTPEDVLLLREIRDQLKVDAAARGR